MPYKNSKQQYLSNLRRMKRRKEEWFAIHGPCKNCDSWENLELDHIDPSTKVSHNIWNWSDEKRNAELLKCQPLCYSCHKEKHKIDKINRRSHGTNTAYSLGCRCDECRLAHAILNRKYSKAKRHFIKKPKNEGLDPINLQDINLQIK